VTADMQARAADLLARYRKFGQAEEDHDAPGHHAAERARILDELDQLFHAETIEIEEIAGELLADVEEALQGAPPSVQAERGRTLLQDLSRQDPKNGAAADLLDRADAVQWIAHLYDRDRRGFNTKMLRLEQAGFPVKHRDAIRQAARDQAEAIKPPLAPETRAHPKEGLAPDGQTWDDTGNARRLVKRYGRDHQYAPGVGWHAWDGRRWAPDETGAVVRAAKRVTDDLLELAKTIDDPDVRKRVLDFASRSRYRPRLEAAVKLAETEPGAYRLADEFDADDLLLNVANGTIDLRTGELRSHDRGDWLTKIAGAAYNPDARCPGFQAFLELIFDSRPDLITYLQRLVGYTLTGDQGEQCFVLLHGTGENGKSTLVGILLGLLGEYATAADAAIYMQVQRGSIRNDIARLRGYRLVASTEPPKAARLDTALVKEITGGDRVTARFLYREAFTFTPKFKPWISCNELPDVDEETHAIWRRLRVIPFDIEISTRVPIQPHYDRRLLADEAAGILTWAVQGCLDWQAHGLGEPQAVTDATSAYRAGQTQPATIPGLIKDCCTRGPNAFTPSDDLYATYQRWANDEGLHPVITSADALVKQLTTTWGYTTARRSVNGQKRRGIEGLALRPGYAQ